MKIGAKHKWHYDGGVWKKQKLPLINGTLILNALKTDFNVLQNVRVQALDLDSIGIYYCRSTSH
jgi:hypothetical protein